MMVRRFDGGSRWIAFKPIDGQNEKMKIIMRGT